MSLKINKSFIHVNHTLLKRNKSDIKYIVIHYVGALGDAKANAEYYGSTYVGASADFFVGHTGDIWQANDYYNYYSWHCGGGLQGTGGHKFFGICTNQNSIGIEMCVRKRSTKTMSATDKDWYFEDATVASAALLVRQLMQELDIDIHHVIRHYDVNGKLCMPLTTELLTPDGWAKLSDIIPGDTVMQFNPDGDKLEFTDVLDTVEPYMSEVLSCRRLEATANHRMYARPNCVNSPRFRDIQYGDMLDGSKQYIVKNAGYYGEGLPVTNDQLRLLVWVQGDGHYMHYGDKYCGIEFHLSKERKIAAVHELLSRMDIPYRDIHKSDGTISIRIYSKPLLNWCEEWLFNKEFTYKFIEMSQPQFEVFWAELLKVDGCVAGDCYTSASQNNLDVVQAVCATHGVRTNKNNLGAEKPIAVSRAKSNYNVSGKGAKVKKYNTMVSCVTVKSGYILIRQNGRTFVVGNCPNPFVMDENKWAAFKKRIMGTIPIENPQPHGIPKSKADFIEKVAGICTELWPDLQILPSVVIAQCCLETGYGLGSDAVELVERNNLLGMKSDLINSTWSTFSTWDGESFVKVTPEVVGGKTIYINDSFRVYPDYRTCIEDYEQFLRNVKNGSGYKYRVIVGMTDPEQVITAISKGGYATDPGYITKVMRIIRENDLTKYDPKTEVKTMGIPEKAVQWALKTAADDTHGYNNAKGRRTGNPDYACSSFVAAAYRAAGLTSIPADAYTATMRKQFLAAGFEDVTEKVNLRTGKGMIPGDVVLNPGKHVEMVANSKLQLVGARGEATGGAANGKAGDQGGEIAVTNWFDFGWRFCLRYPTEKKKETVSYIVQAGLYKVKANADKALQRVRSVVPDAFIKNVGTQYRVQAGAYSVRANAEKRVAQLKKAGISAIIKTE